MGVNIYFIGTAGSGKTYLTFAFRTWMELNSYDAITVNLDPGVKHLPYSADIDIRQWIDLKEVGPDNSSRPPEPQDRGSKKRNRCLRNRLRIV